MFAQDTRKIASLKEHSKNPAAVKLYDQAMQVYVDNDDKKDSVSKAIAFLEAALKVDK